jgi:hypothetical protein
VLKIETKASTHALNSMELVNMKWNKAEATDTKIEKKHMHAIRAAAKL